MSKSRSCTQNVNVKRPFPADDEHKHAFKPCHKCHNHINNSAFKNQTLGSFFALKKMHKKEESIDTQTLRALQLI